MSIERSDDRGVETARLDALAQEIAEEIRLAERAWDDAVQHAIAAGEKLIEVKAIVRQGQWLPWLRANFEGSVRSAQRYMQVARDASRVAHLPTLREAVALLTRPKDELAAPEAEASTEPPGDRKPRWSDEFRLMSDSVREATCQAARAVLLEIAAQGKADGRKRVEVPRWTLEPAMLDLRVTRRLLQEAKDGDLELRAIFEESLAGYVASVSW
jgi:hypothetical protein